MLTTKPSGPSVGRGMPVYSGRKKRRLSPLMILGISVPVLLGMIAVGFFVVLPQINSHAAAALNMDCTLIFPKNPLTAQGLATPYQLVATVPANGPCNEANPNQGAFVQAVILDTDTGAMTAYEPLVIDQGTTPAIAPVVPVLPKNNVVGISFGMNGNALTLQRNARNAGKAGKGKAQKVNMGFRGNVNGNCVNGVAGSVFGQFAYCNTPNFFKAANNLIAAGKITLPALGTANDGLACPSTRDFSAVDMDQSDNVQTQYLANANGQIAQLSVANQAALPNATVLGNPSDNALITKFLDPALGCQPFMIPDQANPGVMTATMITDELHAAAGQQAPIALIPAGDPMVLVNAQPSLTKTNAYRVGVDQTPAATLNDANTTTYCQNLVNLNVTRLALDMAKFQALPSPDGGAAATTLFAFLANRLNASLGDGGLNCTGLLNIQNPVTLITDGNGIVTSATLTNPPLAVGATGTGTGTGTGTTAGGVQQIATGTATIALDTNAGNATVALNITYPNHPNQLVNVNIATGSCTGTTIFTQPENTDGNSMNQANTVINGLQGMTALPATWFFTVSDPALNMIVGCGSVVANGVNGTATLGTVTTPAAAACTPAAGTTTCAPTTTTAQGGTTTTTTPAQPKGNNNGKRHTKW